MDKFNQNNGAIIYNHFMLIPSQSVNKFIHQNNFDAKSSKIGFLNVVKLTF